MDNRPSQPTTLMLAVMLTCCAASPSQNKVAMLTMPVATGTPDKTVRSGNDTAGILRRDYSMAEDRELTAVLSPHATVEFVSKVRKADQAARIAIDILKTTSHPDPLLLQNVRQSVDNLAAVLDDQP